MLGTLMCMFVRAMIIRWRLFARGSLDEMLRMRNLFADRCVKGKDDQYRDRDEVEIHSFVRPRAIFGEEGDKRENSKEYRRRNGKRRETPDVFKRIDPQEPPRWFRHLDARVGLGEKGGGKCK